MAKKPSADSKPLLIRFPVDMLEEIEAYRRLKEGEIPSRADAIRDLVKAALEAAKRK